MAQSSDRNDSNSNDETGSMQAEQILDSIIEHIESTDEPVSGDEPINPENTQIDYSVSDDQLKDDESEQKQVRETDTVADFQDIEKRAAVLASRLGGAGLSYSAGMKKHLEQPTSPVEQVDPPNEPMIEAVIHKDDLDVDSDHFGISLREASNTDELGEANADDNASVEQQHHVSEWYAELQREQNLEPVPSLIVEETQVEPIATVTVTEHFEDQENVPSPELSAEHNVELQDIENNIEALSDSMKKQDEDLIDQSIVEANDQPVGEPQSAAASFDGFDQRVTSLEKHIVQLLDDVALSDKKMGDAVSEVMRSETQKAVKDTIETSDVFGAMKAELAAAAEQRHLQDVRMSDSLDALHDSLKDIGDRVKAIEAGGVVPTQMPDLALPGSGRIVSSVLGSSVGDRELVSSDGSTDADLSVAEEVVEANSPPGADEMPAWLTDSTQDLHGDQLDAPIESADVFAPHTAPEAEPSTEPLEAEKLNDAEQMDIPQNTIEQSAEERPLEIAEEQQPERNLDGVAELADVTEIAIDHPSDHEQNEEKTVMTQNPPPGNDFLRSARAAARAANERARDSDKEGEAVALGKASGKLGNFIAAAKEKETATESEPNEDRVKTFPKNSLFSDKVQGPNSLLVFTSLILFGTSALLLYGMSRDNVESGTVVKLNAAEKTVGQVPVGFRQGGEKNIKNKTNGKKKATRGIGGSSMLESNITVALADDIAIGDGADTLTVNDKFETSRVAEMAQEPSAIRYTGALKDVKANVKTGSLFDQYVSFTAPSGPNTKGREVEDAPAINMGSGGLLKSASNGDAQAQYEVARRYGKGLGVQKSPAISVEWYEKSAKAGYAPAIYRLATMYERGNGVAKDYIRAMKLYVTAAKKGNVKAMHNLAVLYTGGNLGKTNYTSAIHWYRKAAQYGVKDSQFNLAIIYQNGMGGSLDLEKAFKWYSLAARAGDQEAKSMVIDLRKELTDKQQKNLDQKLGTWKAKTPDKTANVVSQYRKASLQHTLDKKS